MTGFWVVVAGWLRSLLLLCALTISIPIRLLSPFLVIFAHDGGQSTKRLSQSAKSFKFGQHVIVYSPSPSASSSSSDYPRACSTARSPPPAASFRIISVKHEPEHSPEPAARSSPPPPTASSSRGRDITQRKSRVKKAASTRGTSKPDTTMGVTCDVCAKVIGRKADLPRHKRLHLSAAEREQMMISCTYPGCTYKNLQQSNVDTHARTHSGEKNKECPSCSFITADPGSLTRHRKAVHGYVPHTRRNGFACGNDNKADAIQERKDRALPYARSSSNTQADPALEYFWLQQQIEMNRNKPFQHYNAQSEAPTIFDNFTPSPRSLEAAVDISKLEDVDIHSDFHPKVLEYSASFVAPAPVSSGSESAETWYWTDWTKEVNEGQEINGYGFDFALQRAPSPEPLATVWPLSASSPPSWSSSSEWFPHHTSFPLLSSETNPKPHPDLPFSTPVDFTSQSSHLIFGSNAQLTPTAAGSLASGFLPISEDIAFPAMPQYPTDDQIAHLQTVLDRRYREEADTFARVYEATNFRLPQPIQVF